MQMANIKKYFKYVFLAAGFLAYIVIICLFRGYDHDEGMYITCANLLNKGFVPYRDFFYTHTPYFLYAIAPLIKIVKYKLLIVRLFSAIFGVISAFFLCFGIFDTDRNRKTALFPTMAAISFIMLGAVAIYTQSGAWNHQLALFFASIGYWTFLYCYKKKHEKLFSVSGFFFALAAGVRVPLVLLFILCCILVFYICQDKKTIVYFSLGFILGLLPLAFFAIFYTQKFIFSVFTIHTYTFMLFKSMGVDYGLSFFQKLAFFAATIFKNPVDFIILIIYVLALVYFRFDLEARISFLFFVVCFFMFLLHTPVWAQYLYPLFMFTLPMISRFFLVIFYRAKIAKYGIVVLLVFAFFVGPFKNYFHSVFLNVQSIPRAIHQNGIIIRSLVEKFALDQKSSVLTLAPLIAEEGELNIYPEFATGPFVWRISSLVAEDKRRSLNIIGPDNLDNFLHEKPPAAVLLGYEKIWEQPLIHWAQNNGYAFIELGGGIKLWVPRTHSANKSLRK